MSKKQDKPGIYKITNVVNNKIYVGQTQDLVKRKYNHFYCLAKGTHENKYLQRSYNKYGVNNFKFEILEECKYEVIDDREIYWINYYDCMVNGYNSIPGGKCARGYKASEATRLKLSLIRKGVKTIPCSDEKKLQIRATNIDTWKDKDLLERHRIANSGINSGSYGKPSWNKGLKMTHEECQKNSNTQLKLWHNDQFAYEQVRNKTNINDEQVLQILDLIDKGYSLLKIKNELGIGYKCIEKIKKHLGGYGVWVDRLKSKIAL